MLMSIDWKSMGGAPGPTRCTAHLSAEPDGEYHTWRPLLSAALCMMNSAPAPAPTQRCRPVHLPERRQGLGAGGAAPSGLLQP